MPYDRKRKRDTMWVGMNMVFDSATTRYFDTTTPENFLFGGVGTNVKATRDFTVLATHAWAGFTVAIPANQAQPVGGIFGLGVGAATAPTFDLDPGYWFAVGMFVPSAGTTTQLAYYAILDGRGKRRVRPGDSFSWDYKGLPVSPWNPRTGTPLVVGQCRLLVTLD